MLRILVVDDEPMVLDSIRLTLASCGFDAVAVGSGAEALARLRVGTFDAVVTDRKMPVMTGEQLAQAIKAEWPEMPVIMLTGFPPDRHPPAVDVILLKPFSTAQLRSTIERIIAKRGPRPS